MFGKSNVATAAESCQCMSASLHARSVYDMVHVRGTVRVLPSPVVYVSASGIVPLSVRIVDSHLGSTLSSQSAVLAL